MLGGVTSEAAHDLVARAAQEIYGLSGPVTLLAGERDLNARVGDHVVKVHAAEMDAAVLDFQDAALAHLAGSPASGLVPRSAVPRSEPVVVVDGVRRRVRALDWLAGRMLADVEPQAPELLRDLGRAVAAVDRALAGFTHPAQHRYSAWNLVQARICWTAWPSSGTPSGVRRGKWWSGTTSPRWRQPSRQLPQQVIHGDANDFNVVVGDGGAVAGSSTSAT